MFRKMRRKGQEITESECIEILTNQPSGVLAFLGDYDYPYAVPMSHVYVDGKIYLGPGGRRRAPRVRGRPDASGPQSTQARLQQRPFHPGVSNRQCLFPER